MNILKFKLTLIYNGKMYSNYGEKMKHLFLTSVIVSLFVLGCSQKKETAETNAWKKFNTIPTYNSVAKNKKPLQENEVIEPPAEMPLVVSVTFNDGYNDAINNSKVNARLNNQREYSEGFKEGSKDRKEGTKKRLIVK